MLVALIRPLPNHIAHYREPARSALVLSLLVIVGLTLGIADHGLDRPVLPLLAGVGVVFAIASLVPRLHVLLSRWDGVLGLALTGGLVMATGTATSIYRPLLVLLLLYAAMFYDTGRLLVTGTLIGLVLALPSVIGGVQPTALAMAVVEIPVWALMAAAVHALVQRTRASARTDGLTGLDNHVTFQSMLHAEHERMRRYGGSYSVLLIDLDHFKHINDTHGHPAGDKVLRAVAKLLTGRTRVTDTVARYGGEEFALLLPETGREQATTVAEHICRVVRDGDLPVPVTVSVGVASSADGMADSAEALLTAADEALYTAKRRGRDRVSVTRPLTAGLSYLALADAGPLEPPEAG